jgi:hypothetical protein
MIAQPVPNVSPEWVPPAPQVPAHGLRYLGYFNTPEGKAWVLLADAQSHHQVQVGSPLPGGFAVAAVGANSVSLSHPAAPTWVEVPIPTATVAVGVVQ